MHNKSIQIPLPLTLPPINLPSSRKAGVISDSSNSINPEDRNFHDWYRFVLSYPPHLVRDYLIDFGFSEDSVILDPFCGTGTTLVESKRYCLKAIGLEANPFPCFASTVKTNWNMNPDELADIAEEIAEETYEILVSQGIDDRAMTCENDVTLSTLNENSMKALIKNSISPLPLHKSLVLLGTINRCEDSPFYKYFLLALGNSLVSNIGNLRFGPEVGVGKIKKDVPVIAFWKQEIKKMVGDLNTTFGRNFPETDVFLGDAREISSMIQPESIDVVITSPPYPNEKDYTRTTRLESVVLGFYEDMSQLRRLKKTLLRSNTRGVYKSDIDDQWVADITKIQDIAEAIETRRIELGKTSGFEKLYPRVTKLYFGGMARHFSDLSKVLKPGAKLAYVVGDQASYLQIMIRTGTILAEIAERLGYQIERIDLFRTRFATATQSDLREEVVVLTWPGGKNR